MANTRGTSKRQNVDAASADISKKLKPDQTSPLTCDYESKRPRTQLLPAGERLLPQIVEELAATDPQGVWLSIPTDPNSAKVFRDISYLHLANAVDRAAWWIQNTIKGTDQTPQTLAYLGPTDSRYLILVIAALKAGHVLLLPSTRNAESTQRKLLEASNCTVLLCAGRERRKIEDMLRVFDLGANVYTIHSVPEQNEMLDQRSMEKYVYGKTYRTERSNAFVILHTSGTSGEAVPIKLPHAYYAYEDLYRTQFAREGVLTFAPLKPGARCLYTGPLYHAGAILFTLMKSLLLNVTMLLPPACVPVTAEVVERCLSNGRADMLGTAPSVLEEICSCISKRKCLMSLRCIFCGSGPMPRIVGDTVRALGVNLLHVYGSTETALLPQLPLDDPAEDWQYFSFHPASGARFVAVDKDGLHELVVERVNKHTPQPCFEVFPAVEQYHTQDTFSAHPVKRGLWKFEGRVDDIITLTNGEKFCPSVAEELIASQANVTGALIVGQGRFQPTLLLELSDCSLNAHQVVDKLWPVIEEANFCSPSYAHVIKDMVVVSEQPFLRTPKGSIRRHATEQHLCAEINRVYERLDCSSVERYHIADVCSLDSLQVFLLKVISTQVAVAQRFSPDTDLFSHGLDSLHVAALVCIINGALKRALGVSNGHGRKMRAQMLYQNPSVSSLTVALHTLVNTQNTRSNDQDCWTKTNRVLLERYTRNLNRLPPTPIYKKRPVLNVVLLTGSTGSLGKHLLHVLIHNAETKHIYCVDRSLDSRLTYFACFPEDIAQSTKVTFLRVPSMDARSLGISDESVYAHLLDNVTDIIHSAWPVNFHLPLQSPPGHESDNASFESHIAAVRRLIDFGATASSRPQLIFISSLASALRYKGSTSGGIPETIIDDPEAPLETGYGRSKWLAEQMLDMAAGSDKLIAKPKVVRIGQVCGPSPDSRSVQRNSHKANPVWPVNEMIPSLIRSSATIGALPESLHALEKLRWIPVNDAARLIIEIAANQADAEQIDGDGALVYNAVNVQGGDSGKSWKTDMMPVIRARLEKITQGPIKVVSMQEWLRRVEKQGIMEADFTGKTQNPALKLISVYEELVESDMHSGLSGIIETERAHRASRHFRSLQPISEAWMEDWMSAWGL